MKTALILSLALSGAAASGQEVIHLWDGDAPFAKGSSLEERVQESWGVPCVRNVTDPTLTVFPARGARTGHAIVVLPGGGYEMESFVAEGSAIAEALAAKGITAAVLKYRLPLADTSDQPHLVPLSDTRRAVSLLRSMSGCYGFNATKVGIMGFSAGGHLAATVSVLRSERRDENPDFAALVYAVTTLSPDNQAWLEESLFHRPMTDDEETRYALVDRVDGGTPPTFLLHAYDDEVVPVSESEAYARALRRAGREVEAHYFARGGHGFGPGRAGDGTAQWIGLVADWIRRQ